jgi:hypothetical protein
MSFSKLCPKCHREQIYSREDSLKSAIKKKSLCVPCFNRTLQEKNIKKFPKKLTKKQIDILMGCLLGDGSLSNPESNGSINSRFSFCQKASNKERVEEIAGILHPFSSKVKIEKGWKPIKSFQNYINHDKNEVLFRATMYTCSHPAFTQLRNEWYKNGRKTVPPTLTLNWCRFAQWVQDDGSNDKKRKKIVLSTHGFSEEEVDFLRQIIERDLGIKTSKHSDRGFYSIYIGRKVYIEVINKMRPHFESECMKYKIQKTICHENI